MDDLHHREQTMQRDVLLVATVSASLLNGMHFSPLFDPVLFLLRPFVASILASPVVLFYLTSILISVMTLVIGGIPAAMYERFRGHAESTPLSIGIWLVATLVLALPGILGATGYFSIE
ncbi:MAG: hypothetical protein SFW09_00620 [Hyphomicrobiaceae bacterium]|nr:hypothetical protein [Hyphomicrobiaceae bacterium]